MKVLAYIFRFLFYFSISLFVFFVGFNITILIGRGVSDTEALMFWIGVLIVSSYLTFRHKINKIIKED